MKAFFARIMPRGIGGQLALLVAGSLLLANVVVSAIFILLSPGFEPPGPPGPPGGSTARLAVVLQLLAAEPPARRDGLLRTVTLALPGVAIAPMEAHALPAGTAQSGDPSFARFAAELGDAVQVRLLTRPSPDTPLRLAAMLADGTSYLVELRQAPGPPPPPRVRLPLITIAAAVLTVVVLSLWAVRWLVAPLRRFSAAADSFGSGNGGIALDETGPSEIRQAAGAFNRMRERIGRLIEERTRMLAAVSHDLRTPLTRLRLRAESLPAQDTRLPLLRDIQLMDTMIGSALSFLRDQDAPEIVETVDLATVLQSICDEFAAVGHAVFYQGPDHVLARCRADAFTRAITNLVDNGVKYGSSTIVSLEVRRDGAAVIAVADDGPGIPEADLDQVFAPFFRSDQARKVEGNRGFGLGLSIARRVIDTHGGSLSVANRSAHGLVATVILPPASTGTIGA
ncbi:MAG: HAMP domain-containing protein [Alphaproteobacteria bacterium]|nr:HAMP domain-containing protein [Alphaproteobacteria bacterium]